METAETLKRDARQELADSIDDLFLAATLFDRAGKPELAKRIVTHAYALRALLLNWGAS